MSDALHSYFSELETIWEKVTQTQSENLEKGARMLADATISDHNIFVFGCSHAGLLAFEMYYRSGGMANINPVRAPGLYLDIDPATMTSEMERLPEYGKIIVDNLPIQKNDILMIHSVSGRNTVAVDAALEAKKKGVILIVLTNLSYSQSVTSRHSSGKKLYELADLVLDNCGTIGDACVCLHDLPVKIGPTSTAVGAAMLNAMMSRAVEMIIQKGGVPPVLMSANMNGGDEYNKKILSLYKSHIFYMGPLGQA